ncbi:LysR substrate-binding domain-containing protein [Aggregatibacter kilianii]|uniref:LysR substrate-binding domain-containing protein n=1 Tax=Aggregatibacter kilianii TaxID=2025884 RepID=UPI000D65091E|nr:LysR substrate-binding domain-containing protein [Aggregatibacter kilianii]
MKIAFLNALQAFEVAYRRQSFSAAAEELSVTPAAVGQLVKSLEEYLGQPLFVRQTGGKARLIPTEIAELAIGDIQAGFDRLGFGLEKLKSKSDNNVLNVTVSPAFAGKWLLPRLEQFQSVYPELEIMLNTNARAVDFLTENVDIGIRYGKGEWENVAAEKWLEERLFPVCSPQFLASHKIEKPTDLLHQPLIHDLSMPTESGFLGWNDWFKENLSLAMSVPVKGLRINNSAAVLQAAIDGQGVALARSVMAADDLAAGRLIRLFPDLDCIAGLAYYLVYRPEHCQRKKICLFRDWLMAQI